MSLVVGRSLLASCGRSVAGSKNECVMPYRCRSCAMKLKVPPVYFVFKLNYNAIISEV